MTDTLRDKVEREIDNPEHPCRHPKPRVMMCADCAVSIAVRLIERERAYQNILQGHYESATKRAEAAERDLEVVQSYRREENDRLLAAEKKYDTLMASWEETAAQLTAAERERNRPHACSDPLRHEDRIVEKLLAAEKEFDEARRALAERGHVAACDCHVRKNVVGCDIHVGRPCIDPRCAPPKGEGRDTQREARQPSEVAEKLKALDDVTGLLDGATEEQVRRFDEVAEESECGPAGQRCRGGFDGLDPVDPCPKHEAEEEPDEGSEGYSRFDYGDR